MLELQRFLICIALLILTSCTGRPANVFPVTDFSIDNYLGVWYEIARTDNKFERGLINVTATYSAQSDGGMKVVNRGYDQNSGEMREAEGQAYFVGRESDGHLKVSFFGPFFSSYVIFKYVKGRYAFVSGYSHDYLWLLSREQKVSKNLLNEFLLESQALGFDTSNLIYNPNSVY